MGFHGSPESVLEEVDENVEGDGGESAEKSDESGGEEQKDIFAAARAFHPGVNNPMRPANQGAQAMAEGSEIFGFEGHGKGA